MTTPQPVTEYRHHRAGTIQALHHEDWPDAGQADWVAVTSPGGRRIGSVIDSRADAGGHPSPEMPADEDATPFDSFDARGKYITCTHSLRGALLAIGNRA